MKNIYFKGLEKALNDGCYVKVFNCSLRYPVVRVEKKDVKTNKEELVSYSENGNVLATLNAASNKIIFEAVGQNPSEPIICENTLIDKVVDQGYTLHFYKLSNGQVLSTICGGGYGNYIPVKSIISDDIKTGFETLNATLQSFDFNESHDFFNFVESQTAPVYEYQKTLQQETKK